MATKGVMGEYICGHCGSSNMRSERYIEKGRGVTRIVLVCNQCNQEDYYDSLGN